MEIKEIKSIAETNRELETNKRYGELVASEELKRVREQPVKEHAASPPKRPSPKAKRRVSVFAAAALTTIVTVSAVIGLSLSVKLISFIAGYTSLEIVLDIENADNRTLTAQLSRRGDPISEHEITAGKGVRLAFQDLDMGCEYLLQILSGDGETVYSQTFATNSPVTFYEKNEEPDRLYFTIDYSVFAGYSEITATLTSADGLDFMAIDYSENGESYIDKTALFAGTYYFALLGHTSESSDYPVNLFGTEMEFDGIKLPIFTFFETAEGISLHMADGETGPYLLKYAALERDGVYTRFELTIGAETQLIPAALLTEGMYVVYLIGERQTDYGTASVALYKHYLSWSA